MTETRERRRRDAHRQVIGYAGLALPVILPIVSGLRPITGLPPWKILDSISAYYYTGAVAPFVGLLVALGLTLVTYPGHPNKYHWADRACGIAAGCAAISIAVFPGEPPTGIPALPWWTSTTNTIHYVSAGVLFTMFAVFSLWLFRIGRDRNRNRIYLVCGIAIIASMVWVYLAHKRHDKIFYAESAGIIAFAFSWLTKGEADQSIRRKVRATFGRNR